MSIFYKSPRVGKGGRLFSLYKFRTLKIGTDKTSSFASEGQYTWCGRFLRKTKLDELPQIINWLKRDINIVGVRPEEQKTVDVIPEDLRQVLLSRRPGMTSLASVYFYNEEELLKKAPDAYEIYWTKIKPVKFILDAFYIENKSLPLDVAIIWLTFKKVVKSFFT